MSELRDSLALPPVPPPADASHPLRDRALIAIFALLLPLLALVSPPGDATAEREQRNRAPWPAPAKLLRPAQFAAEFERAFEDRFGARGTLIEYQHAAVVRLFGISPVPRVLVGAEGWLYWLGEDARSLDRNYRGIVAFSDGEVAAIANEFARRHAFLAARGIPYLVVVVPEKFTIYPEHLPSWVARAGQPTPYARVMERLAADGIVQPIDLRPLLAGAKSGERLYYQTDSHWNMAGAGVGYRAIMDGIAKALPGRDAAIAPPLRPPYVPGADVYWGDLARMIGVPTMFREPDFLPIWKLYADPSGLCGKRVDRNDDPTLEVYACDRPGLPRAVMLRDSMAIPLVPMLAENFSRIVYTSRRQLDPAMIAAEKPDVVIEELVERSIHTPAAFPMP